MSDGSPARASARSVEELVARARRGDLRAVAKLITLVESAEQALPELAAALAPVTGRAQVIGLTGAPGVGKSSTTAALVRAFRAAGRRVGVLAVDPASPFTGGAILGDRIRMQEHATDPGVFIRSMSNRGQLGGLAAATPQAVRVLDAAGCEVILVETVGVGQVEVSIASLADTTLVLLAPGMGDAVQAAKAGILEIGDVFVVNKADRDGAGAAYHDLQGMIALADRAPGEWRPRVVRTVATRSEGIEELVAAIEAHQQWLRRHGELARRRRRRAAAEIEALVLAEVARRLSGEPARLAPYATAVATGQEDPVTAARAILAELGLAPGPAVRGGAGAGEGGYG